MYRVFTAQPATRGNPFGRPLVRNPQFVPQQRPQRGSGGSCPAGWHYEMVQHLGYICVKNDVPSKPTPSSPAGGSGSIAIPNILMRPPRTGWLRGQNPTCPPGRWLGRDGLCHYGPKDLKDPWPTKPTPLKAPKKHIMPRPCKEPIPGMFCHYTKDGYCKCWY